MSITFKEVEHTYSENTPFSYHALKGIDLNIKTGSMTALIGHTGSGKSTLIQHINALLLPTAGEIKVDDILITATDKPETLKPLRKKAGLVFQFPEYQLFEETILKDIIFGPKNFGVNEEEAIEIAKETLELVGLDESYLEKSPFDLSGGQKRRVAIAGILAMNPDILILDEPTAGLDVLARDELLDVLRKYMEEDESRSILISSHISSDLEGLCDDLYMIHNGHVIMHEETDVLLSDYAILKLDQNQYQKLDRQYILRIKKEPFGYSCLTNQKQYYLDNYPSIVVEKGNIDDVIMLMIKGEK